MTAQLENTEDLAAALAFIVQNRTRSTGSQRSAVDEEVKLQMLAYEISRYSPDFADELANEGRQMLQAATW